MIITVEALKELYTSLGGELTDTYDSIANGIPVSDYNVIPDVIQALAQKTGGGSGSSLPAVTSDDNGKLLTVVEGAWDKAEASGGVEWFNGTISGTTFTLGDNKHLSDIKAALDAGKVVMLNDGGNNNYYYTLVRYRASEGLFSCVTVLGTSVHIKQIIFASWGSSANTGTYSDTTISTQ